MAFDIYFVELKRDFFMDFADNIYVNEYWHYISNYDLLVHDYDMLYKKAQDSIKNEKIYAYRKILMNEIANQKTLYDTIYFIILHDKYIKSRWCNCINYYIYNYKYYE
jgi:hypothetical protein